MWLKSKPKVILENKKTVALFTMVFFLLNTPSSSSQILHGIVWDSINVVPYANISIKKINDRETIFKFTTSDENGFYTIPLDFPKDSLFIEVSSKFHEIFIKRLNAIPTVNNKLKLDIILQVKTNKLDEIKIKAIQRIEIKKDTIIYNPEAFKDGTEKTVEDLLKKLPGIQVENNGEIKFKGKTIKKLLLDGDDLFNSSYTIGSKNIDVKLIERVQGIENYNENSLLKGLKDTEDVVLNLIIKKGTTDFSGNSTIGYGIEKKYNISTTGLLVSKTHKGFGVVSYNDIGYNYTPFNFKSEFITSANQKYNPYYPDLLLNEGYFGSSLEDGYQNLNNSFYTSANSLHKILKKSLIKYNLGYYSDNLNRTNITNSTINYENSQIIYSNIENLIKTPKTYSAQLSFSNKEKDSVHWEYFGSAIVKNSKFENNSLNNDFNQESILYGKQILIEQNFEYSKRLNVNNAIETQFNYQYSDGPQNLKINPGTLFSTDDENPMTLNHQKSTFKKNNFQLKTTLLGKKNNWNYAIALGHLHVNTTYNSSLKSDQSNENMYDYTLLKNNFDYQIDLTFINPTLILKFKEDVIKFGVNLEYSNLFLDDAIREITMDSHNILLLPTIKHIHTLSPKMSLRNSYSYSENLPKENMLFNGVIQTNFRTFNSNDVTLENLKIHRFETSLKYFDFYKRETILAGFKYNLKKNSYFSDSDITENITVNSSIFRKIDLSDYGIFINSETYVHFLRSTLEFNGDYSLMNDRNIINTSGFQNVKYESVQLQFGLRSGFKSKMNFETKLFYDRNVYLVEKNKNQFESLNNQFKVVYKANDSFFANCVANFISPNLSNNVHYWFVDMEFILNSKNKKYQYSILGKNLTGNKYFKTLYVDDISETSIAHNLIDRYVMFKTNFSF